MTAFLFLGFVAVVTVALVVAGFHFLPRRTAMILATGLATWLPYVGALSYAGVVRNAALRPPGIAYILIPTATLVVFLAVSATGARVARSVPLWVLLGLQTYRVGVELFLHRLWVEGLVPRMLTFEGANVDILIGASAPLIAWAVAKGREKAGLALAWNVLGLFALANVVIRSALTAPGPFNFIHADVPNLAVGTYPYTYIPGFLAPLAVALHVLAIRSLRAAPRCSSPFS